jgi:hypothetical protein
VHKLDQETLLAIGRMTVAATDLEHGLAWIATSAVSADGPAKSARADAPASTATTHTGASNGAADAGTSNATAHAGALFARAGEPLRAARAWAESAPADLRSERAGAVEGAATQLARSQAALRSLWHDEGPATVPRFDEIAMFLTRARDALTDLAAHRPAS